MVGLWNRISYDYGGDDPQPEPEPGPSPEPEPTPQPDPGPSPAEQVKAVVDTGGHGKLKTHPTKGSSALSKAGRLDEGTQVLIVKQSGDWSLIRVVDKNDAIWYCWVMSKYLRTQDDPEPDPEPKPPKTTYYTVTIEHLTEYDVEALKARYDGAVSVEREE
jgi:hypothetical protein